MSNYKVCFFNKGSVHYRKNIWMLMDQELGCDFYFGDNRRDNIKPIDTSLLKNFKGYFKNIYIGPFFWQRGALKLLKKDYTDIILQGDIYSITMWTMLVLSKLYRKNIYLWTHGAYGDESFLKRKISVLNTKLATGILLYGNHARELLIKWGVSEKKLHVIYNSLDYDQQLKLRKNVQSSNIFNEHFGNDNKNIVFIGRLTKVKKLDQLINTIALLKKDGLNCNLTFVGDGDIKKELLELSKQLGVESNVWFYGACYDEAKNAELLYNADLCVSPGNVGLTAMHAMMFGCPVISNNNFLTQMPEYEAIKEEVTGSFFEENNMDSLSKSIQKWFSAHSDREMIRESCYRVIDKKYNPHIQVKKIEQIINNQNI